MESDTKGTFGRRLGVQQPTMAMRGLLGCALFLATVLTSTAIPTVKNFEKKLYDDLFVTRPIETQVRPVNNSQDKISLQVGISVIQISEVDEEKDSMKINGWLYLTWNDFNLQWDPSEYGGIDNLHIDPRKIWNPDLMIYNNADSRDADVSFDTLAIVFQNGTVLWVPPTTFHVLCQIDARFFPYDKQKCSIKLGSWTYHNKLISLDLASQDGLENLWENSQWRIDSLISEKHSTLYPCCPDQFYDDVKFTLQMSRCASYFKMTLVTPSVIAMALILMLFYLPPSAPERLQLGGFIAVFQMILMTNIIWEVPHNGKSVPVIVLFNGISLIFVGLSIGLSIVLWRLMHRSTRTSVPSLLQWITTSRITRVLCVQQENRLSQDCKENALDAPAPDSDWSLVAAVLNRIFFIIYFFVYLILIAVVFIPTEPRPKASTVATAAAEQSREPDGAADDDDEPSDAPADNRYRPLARTLFAGVVFFIALETLYSNLPFAASPIKGVCNLTIESTTLLNRYGHHVAQFSSPKTQEVHNCWYRFRFPKELRLQLHVLSLENVGSFNGSRCVGGYLRLSDAVDTGSTGVVGELCGHHETFFPAVILYSEGGEATLELQASPTNANASGFEALVNFTRKDDEVFGLHRSGGKKVNGTDCDWIYEDCLCSDTSRCEIVSPGYPGIFGGPLRCKYYLQTEKCHPSQVQFRLMDWQLPKKSCQDHTLRIHGGSSTDGMDICGKQESIIMPMQNSGRIVLDFTSNYVPPPYNYTGFWIIAERIPYLDQDYTNVGSPNGNKITGCNFFYEGDFDIPEGVFTIPYKNNKIRRSLIANNCTYIFIPKEQQLIKLVFNKIFNRTRTRQDLHPFCSTICDDVSCYCDFGSKEKTEVNHLLIVAQDERLLLCLCDDLETFPLQFRSSQPIHITYYLADPKRASEFQFYVTYSFQDFNDCGDKYLGESPGIIFSKQPETTELQERTVFQYIVCQWIIHSTTDAELVLDLSASNNGHCKLLNITITTMDSYEESEKLLDTYCSGDDRRELRIPQEYQSISVRLTVSGSSHIDYKITWIFQPKQGLIQSQTISSKARGKPTCVSSLTLVLLFMFLYLLSQY